MSDTKRSIADVLASVSGLPSTDIHELWRQVRDNHLKLEQCGGHDFQPATHDLSGLPVQYLNGKPRQYRCERCEGILDAMAVSWYWKGLRHGRNG